MVFLLFAILLGLAAAYGYYLDKQNEDFQNRWICTCRSALAGSSFAMFFCFVLWLFFRQAEAGLGKRNGEAHLPRIDGSARIDLPNQGVASRLSSPTLPADTIFKLQTRLQAASVTSLCPDSIVWLRQQLGEQVVYRIAVSRGNKSQLLALPSDRVSFVAGASGEVVELGYWSYHVSLWGARRLTQDSARYLVSVPHNVTWWDFKGPNCP